MYRFVTNMWDAYYTSKTNALLLLGEEKADKQHTHISAASLKYSVDIINEYKRKKMNIILIIKIIIQLESDSEIAASY